MTKTIMILAIATAFVAGSIMIGTMADAQKDDVEKGNPIVDALNNIAAAISGIDPNVNVSPTPINVSPTPITVNVDPTPITITAAQGDKGDKGDTGDQGPQGDQGPALTLYYIEESSTTSGPFPSKFVLCDPGDIVTGGGSATNSDLTLLNDFPTEGFGSPGPGINNGWINRYSNPGLLTVSVTAFAICADVAP